MHYCSKPSQRSPAFSAGRTTPAATQPDRHRQQKITAKTCRNVHIKHCQLVCKQRGR
jgi:hypothetical protein